MKKIIVVGIVLIMCLSMSFSAFAANGGFVSSPSKNSAPEVVGVTEENNQSGQQIVIDITSFANRGNLTGTKSDNFEKAYTDIASNTDITKLASKLKEIANNKNINPENLAVNDLFDVSANVDDHGKLTIKIKLQNSKNFIALLHYHNNTWTVVDNATLDGDVLTFTVDDLSPFAVVVDKQANTTTAPLTSENNAPYVFGALALVASMAVVVTLKKSKVGC